LLNWQYQLSPETKERRKERAIIEAEIIQLTDEKGQKGEIRQNCIIEERNQLEDQLTKMEESRKIRLSTDTICRKMYITELSNQFKRFPSFEELTKGGI